MPNQPCVVVGCDGTPDGDPALRFAAREARLHHALLVVLTAYDRPLDPDLDDFDTPVAQLRAKARARAENALHRAFASSSDVLPDYEVVAAEGEPARVLLNHATDAIMIVIGHHHRHMFQRFFSHHTRPHLLHDSRVPITIVPPP